MGASASDPSPLVLEVARRTGNGTVDPSDGHARWEVYRRAMDSPDEWDALLEIVGREPDPSIAMSVVLRMLERVPEAERTAWAERVPLEEKRSSALLRVRELRILEAARGAAAAERAPASDEVPEWSDWLQRRAAEESVSPEVLELLSQSGRTRRVRHVAAQRLRVLRRTR
ncbi:hypothetical protein [Streptomyces sp. NPDC057877]|uniref:hypothetical protein n=1 Tax=Streptomyces sp. NPDC057877 TaxID=3346269 RepID=UPI0036AA16AF